jgi:transposase-like protein
MTQDHILRKDTRGRVVVTAERRAGLLAQFDQSGISGIQFARLSGINYSTLASWLQQRRKRQRGTATAPATPPRGEPGPEVRWLEAVVAGEEKPSPVEAATKTALVMHGPGGVWWKIEDEPQARLAAVMLWHLEAQATC